MYEVDVTIIGAGAVGLSIACEVSAGGNLDVVVLEKESGPGMGISSRSSEVVHAGIYYPEDFLKTSLCVRGSRLLYEFCNKFNVPVKKSGKIVVAVTENERESIEKLYLRGIRNGVDSLKLLDNKDIKKIEPNVNGICALHSPETGILDSHFLVKRLEVATLDNHAKILYGTNLYGLDIVHGGYLCYVRDSNTSYCFRSRIVINAAGLDADKIPVLVGIDIMKAGYRIYLVKGEYFRIKGSKAVMINGLVYPSPDKDLIGLGIHATKDIAGSVRLGPNAFYIDDINYDTDPSHQSRFYDGVKDYLPFIEMKDLYPDTAGIRPKIQNREENVKDFIIHHESDHGLDGFINLVGIESPGLTACLAIGKYVNELITCEC